MDLQPVHAYVFICKVTIQTGSKINNVCHFSLQQSIIAVKEPFRFESRQWGKVNDFIEGNDVLATRDN